MSDPEIGFSLQLPLRMNSNVARSRIEPNKWLPSTVNKKASNIPQQRGSVQMDSGKKTARFVGTLFLTAMVASLLGGSLVDSIISAPNLASTVSDNKTQLIIGLLLELVNAIAVVGIAALMFPLLKRYNESMSLGYLSFRIIEAAFCSAIVITPLALIRLSQQYVEAGSADPSYYQVAGALSIAERASVAGLLIPIFFVAGALLFYSLLYRSKL
ncbi:MAG TPA: DUF4386 domain-containing protein, partial [Anaerolineales bacterium]|nr:DUF4386 domain-containing protein [Anaerolineales bacterium]